MLTDDDLTRRYGAALAALTAICRWPAHLACIGGAQRALCGELRNGLRIELGSDLLTGHGPDTRLAVFLFDEEGQPAYLDVDAGALADRLTAAAALTGVEIAALRSGLRAPGLDPAITLSRPAPAVTESLRALAAALASFRSAARRGTDAETAAASELAAAAQNLLDQHTPSDTGARR